MFYFAVNGKLKHKMFFPQVFSLKPHFKKAFNFQMLPIHTEGNRKKHLLKSKRMEKLVLPKANSNRLGLGIKIDGLIEQTGRNFPLLLEFLDKKRKAENTSGRWSRQLAKIRQL